VLPATADGHLHDTGGRASFSISKDIWGDNDRDSGKGFLLTQLIA
jgi:hypothetical protein